MHHHWEHFQVKRWYVASIIKNVYVVELSVEIAISPAVFSLQFETDHSGWPTSSIVVLMMFDSGAKERLSQGTKVVSPSLNGVVAGFSESKGSRIP